MKVLLQALQTDLSEITQESSVHMNWAPPSGDANPPAEAPPSTRTSQAQGVGAVPTLDLHPNARSNFDARAELLLGMVSVVPPGLGLGDESPGSQAEPPFTTPLPPNAVLGRSVLFHDYEGAPVARVFREDSFEAGLKGDDYQALRAIAETLQRTPAMRSLVAVETLERLIFEWVRERTAGRTDRPMTDVVLDQTAALLRDHDVVLPLFRVVLAAPVQIGRVTLRTITSGDFARWEAAAGGPAASASAGARRLTFLAERRRMQGFAAATLSVYGERAFALVEALEEAEEATAMLRLFSPAILSPSARSFCTLWGQEGIASPTYLLFEPSRGGLRAGSFLDIQQDFVWRLDAERVQLIRDEALDALVASLFSGPPSAFAYEIRTALVLYSQSALRTTPVDKLLAILLPLEAFLLRSDHESITENIAMRFAWATADSYAERKQMRKVAQAVYAMRSAYLHHRTPIESLQQLETLREFMQYAWRFFLKLGMDVVSRYSDRPSFLAALDERRLGGPES